MDFLLDYLKENQMENVSLPARLDGITGKDLKAGIKKIMSQGIVRFTLDAAPVESIDSAGVGYLVQILKIARSLHGDVLIKDLRGQPLELFRMAGLEKLFNLEIDGKLHHVQENLFTAESANLEIRHEHIHGVGIFHLAGEMRYPEGSRKFMEKTLLALAHRNRIIVDMAGLRYLDRSSAEAFETLNFLLSTSSSELRLVHLAESIRELFSFTGIDRSIAIYENLDDALEGWT